MSSKFSQTLLANRKVILDAFKTIEIMNKNRPKDAKVEISQSKSVKFHEIAYSKSTNKQEKVMKELNEFLNSGELKLNKYSNTKHHTAKKSVDTINKNYAKTGNQEKYINDIQKSLNAPHRPLSVSYLVYRDPVKQDEDAVVDAALKAVSKGKRRVRMQEDYEQFGGINHATISCDPAKYNIVKGVFVKRYTNDDIKTHELSQTNPIYNMYLAFLCNDKEARINLTSSQADTYLKAIKIIEIKKVEYDDEMEKQYKDSKSSKIKDFNMDRQNKHEDVKMIYSKWRIEEYNPDAKTCGELVSNNKFKVKNSCVINCIISKLGDRYSLSREKILKQIGRLDLLECDETPLSINDILPFFYKHKINLICFDALGHVILNTKLPNEKANAVHLMVTDNHCILLNDIRSIAQIINADDYENAEEFVLGSNFNTPSESVERKHKFINTVDDIVEIVRNNISDEDAVVHVIHRNDDIDSVLWNLVNVCGYYPRIVKRNLNVSSLIFTVGKLKIIISSQELDSMPNERKLIFNNEIQYDAYYNANDKFVKEYLKMEYKSMYNQDDVALEAQYQIRPKCMSFNDVKVKTAFELDMNKCYTHLLGKITKIPVFNTFDRFVAYNGEEIEDLNFYIIKSEVLTILTMDIHTRIYGFLLKYIKVEDRTILYVKKPYNVIDVDFQTPIDNLMKTQICDDVMQETAAKKNIVNVLTGLLERKTNKSCTTLLSKDVKQALFYQYAYNGRMMKITKNEGDAVEETININQLSDDEEDEEEHDDDEAFFTVDINKERELTNGFKYIKELIYALNDEINFNLYNKLIKKGAVVYCIKTDALLIDKKGYDIVMKMDILGTSIGQYKMKEKDLCMPSTRYMMKYNELIPLCIQGFENIEISDEWSTTEIQGHVLQGGVIIEAKWAGSGKSTAIQKAEITKLFATPSNLLAQKLNVDAVTVYKLLGLLVGTDTMAAATDITNYKMICFDEIYAYSIHMLHKVKRYMEAHPEIVFSATGDPKQLPPIEKKKNSTQYAADCISQIFKKRIMLNTIKRCKTPEDGVRMAAYYEDILNENLDIYETFKKHGIKMVANGFENITTNKNISYYVEHTYALGEHMHARKYKTKYAPGVVLICRVSNFKDVNKEKMTVNKEYVIKNVLNKYLILQDTQTNFEHVVSINTPAKTFSYSYCITGYSSQGTTIDEPITVLSVGMPHVDRAWIYVATSRNRSLDDISIYEQSEAEIKNMQFKANWGYFEEKVNGYKRQDAMKKRAIDEETYIGAEFFLSALKKNKRCKGTKYNACGVGFYIMNTNGHITSNITAQRLDNTKAHTHDNCELLCLNCNRQLR